MGQPWEAFCRDAINLRYQLLPYLYTLVEEASRTGAPISRPMLYTFPDDVTVAGLEDQFLFGGDLLVAPALAEGQRQRDVRFPAGAWRDWRSGHRYPGPLTAHIETPLDAAPLFAREGAIIPLGPVVQYVGELAAEPLTLVCALGPEDGARAEGTLYEDDGATHDHEHGAWSRIRFSAAREGQRVTVRAEPPEGPYRATRGGVTVELRLPLDGPRAAHASVRAARLEGRALPAQALEREQRRYETIVRARLGDIAAPFTLTLDLA